MFNESINLSTQQDFVIVLLLQYARSLSHLKYNGKLKTNTV